MFVLIEDWWNERLRLLVYEHVSGGGFSDEAIPVSVLSEGFGMLRTLISDFKAAGHSVTTTLDSRIARLNPPIAADNIASVFSSREISANLRKLSLESDASYVIAPETDGVLQSLLKLVQQMGIASLNCQVDAVKKMADKASFYEFMSKLGMGGCHCRPQTIQPQLYPPLLTLHVASMDIVEKLGREPGICLL